MFAFGYLHFGEDAAEFGGEVAQAVVGEDGDDHADVGIMVGYFDGGSNITAGGDATEDAFFTGQAAGHFEGFIGGGGNDSIQVFDMQHFWYKTVADAFNFMRSPGAAGEDVALFWLDGEYFDVGVLLFEVLRCACDSAACPLGQNQGANFAACLFPDLRAGGAIMGLDIIGIDKLANLPVFARCGSFQFLHFFDDEVDVAFGARGEYKLRAIGENGLFAFVTHALGHDDDNMVAFGGCDARGGDTGVAGGALDDAHTRSEITAPLGL